MVTNKPTLTQRIKRWLWRRLFRAEHLRLHRAVYSYNPHWRSEVRGDQRQAHLVEMNTLRRVVLMMDQQDVELPHPDPADLNDIPAAHHP